MKKALALILATAMMLSLAACGGSSSSTAASETASEATSEAASEAAAPADGSITLTVSLPLGQWTDNFDQLIESYMAEHPEIAAIEANFPSSDVYNDLLKSALASGDLPDIISVSYGVLNEEWHQYCVDLSTDFPAYADLTDAQIASGTYNDKFIIAPIYVEGTGIMYNMRILESVGWDHTPQTRDELLQLCKDLTAAGITPFMHQWAETYLNLFNWVGTTWLGNKDDQIGYLNNMLTGGEFDLDTDAEWNDFMDTYEQVLIPYAQEGAIATDKWTCRNAFFLEECAMLVGEGSWETPNIANTNPDLLEYVKQDVLPISNDAAVNNLQIQSITLAVTDDEDPAQVKAAKEFASYIIDSEEARLWHQELMGSPTAVTTLAASENLPRLAVDVIDLMQADKAAESMYTYMPAVIQTDLEEAWARFVAGDLSRADFTARYEQIFIDYADGLYG